MNGGSRLALPEWPKLSRSSDDHRISKPCRSRSASDCWSIAKPPSATPNVSRPASSSPRCARAHAWKMSIGARHAASTAPSSPDSSAATGSTATRTCSSPGQPGSARAGLPAPSVTNKACRDNRSVQYHRVPRLFEALALARGDGRYGRMLKTIGRVQLLILDDWGLSVLNPSERRDLLEILDDRHGRASTIVTSQIPVEHWHDVIGDPTLGDAILDRLVHNAHRLQLTGESMRKQNARNQALDANSNA